jgi:hypothetical protein
MWHVDGCTVEHAGSLIISQGACRLQLFVDGATRKGDDWDHPTIAALERPNRATCIGRTVRGGTITLVGCSLPQWNSLGGINNDTASLELSVSVSQAWSGPARLHADPVYTILTLIAPGLHNVLANAHLEHKFLDEEASTETLVGQLRDLTKARDAYLLYETKSPRATINCKGKSFEIVFSTYLNHSQSSLEGINIRSRDEIRIQAASAMTVEELLAIKFEIQQFFSLLCIGPFIPQSITIYSDEELTGTALIWHFGQNEPIESVKRMPHQILARLGERPELVQTVLARWFEASEQRALARWLVYDTMSETTFSNSRFLSVAQAWEILGRELNTQPMHDRKLFADACDEAADVLLKRLGAETADRLKGMLKSNNRPNFRILVAECLKAVPQLALLKICRDTDNFARTVSKVRNTLTHMDPDPEGKFSIEYASQLSLPLTIKLTALFCIIEAGSLGLPLDNLESMLANNNMARMACRPLPT